MRTSFKVLLPLLLLLAPPAVVQAQFTFTTNNGSITITGYTGPGGDVTIPDTTNGLPVTSIGTNAFYDCWSLTSVIIPDSVTSIGLDAFSYCNSLTSVTIPDSVTSIGQAAFCGCTSLASVTIPDSVTNIGDYAFSSCTSLTNIEIPNSVTSIGLDAFGYCTNLTAITVDTNNPAYSDVDGVLFSKSQTTLVEYPGGISGSYTIPNRVTSIGDCAFWDCFGLTNIEIPNSVTSIGADAFIDCTSLTNIEIPNSVTSLGQSAFSSCNSLTSARVGNGVSDIGLGAFADCLTLTNVTIGNSVTNIGNSAFYDCRSLRVVQFNGNPPILGSSVFSFDPNATVYYQPGTVGWASMFGGLPAVEMEFGYTINGNAITITAYSDVAGGPVSIPSNINGVPVTSIDNSAFAYWTRLTSITIPNSVTNIGDNAFFGCTRLTSVTVPNSVTCIGDNTFQWCDSLTSITIPNSVTNIGDNAFFGCTTLLGVYFRSNAPSIGSYLFAYASPTVYYLPGTTGWGSTYSGRPTMLWNPEPQRIAVQTNGFGFTITGTTNIPIVVEASTNLQGGSWTALQTCTLTNGSIYFSDPQWTNYPGRFYRLRSP